jgi:NADH:ubiquinone oxidoreductase subunit K
MTWVAGLIGGFGLVCMITRGSLLGLLIGIQLLVMGSTMLFVLAGIATGSPIPGDVFGFFITLGGVAQLVAGYAFAVRFFFLKKSVSMDDLKALKQ